MSGFGVGDWLLGVGGNATWDVIKALYSSVKKDLGRRIGRGDADFEFDGVSRIINGAMDVLSGAPVGGVGQLATVFHRWVVNVPDQLLRQSVSGWLQEPSVRENARALTTHLLNQEDFEPFRSSLVDSFSAYTGDSVEAGDAVVRIVIRFIGETIEGSMTDGERVLFAKAQLTHNAVRAVQESIVHLTDKIAVLPVQSGQPLSSDDQRLLRAFRASQKAESFLRERFRASGNGLGDLLAAVSPRVRKLDGELVTALKKFVPVRNVLMHVEKPSIGAVEIDALLDELEAALGRNSASSLAETTLALQPRHWIVGADGFGEFETISEAISCSAAGDQILVLPGVYREALAIERPLSIFGKGESADDVTIEAEHDVVEIGASNVVLSNVRLKSSGRHSFGALVLPGSSRTVISECSFAVGEGEGLVVLNAAGVTVNECRFAKCRVGLRIEANVVAKQCVFTENHHGILSRGNAESTVEECSFAANQIDVELQDGTTARIHDNEFQAGAFAIVAVGNPSGRIYSNRFPGYGIESRFVRMDDAPALVFEA